MKKIYSLLLAVMLLAFYSCDDYLDKKPSTSIDADEALTNMKDVNFALNGVYSAFKSSGYYGKSLTVVPDIMTDELYSVIGYSNNYGEMYKWSYTSSMGSSPWGVMYATIIRSSNILNVIDDIEGDSIQKASIKGEALMGRALAHFDLVKIYGKAYNNATASTDLGVPVVTEYKIAQPARNSIEEVYAQAIADATAAYDLIPAIEGDYISDQQIRYFTRPSVDAFLARLYLYMNNFDKAIFHASKLIDNPKFSLSEGSDFQTMWAKDFGSEIIFKLGLTVADASGITPGYSYYNDSQGLPKPDYVPAEWLIDMYDTNNDIRYASYFETVKTSYNDWVTTLVNKYPGNPEFDGSNQNGAHMPKVFRLAEMYLIRAEAYAEMGDHDAEAMTDLNTLRTARIQGYSDEFLTGSDLKDAIWNERTKEMAFEGHRFFDLKRKGLGFTRVPQENTVSGPNELSIKPSNHRWLWAIPQSEFNGNVNMEQNPGY